MLSSPLPAPPRRELQSQDNDQRVCSQGDPVPVGAAFVLIHCATGKRLAGVMLTMPSAFGME